MLIFILLDINHISREVIDINSFSIDMKFCKSKPFSYFILFRLLYIVHYCIFLENETSHRKGPGL